MKEVRTITCRLAHRLLNRRLEAALPPADEARLQAHLAICAACAEQTQRLEAALRVLRAAPAPEPSSALASRIRAAAVQASRPAPAPARPLRLAPAWAAAALTAVVFVLVFATRWSGPAVPVASPAGPAPPVVAVAPPEAPPEEPVPRVAAAPETDVVVAAVTERSPVRAGRRRARVGPSRPAPPSAARPAPAPRLAYARTRMAMADMTAARPHTPLAAPEGLARVTPVDLADGTRVSRNSGSFADEVVGGLIAEAVLSNYLEGAPAGVRATPAVMTTGGGS